jgi:hypothetical protein
MLMPDVDRLHARQAGEGCRPMHVAVAHQDELRVDPLCEEGLCEGFIELGHVRWPTKMKEVRKQYACLR